MIRTREAVETDEASYLLIALAASVQLLPRPERELKKLGAL